MLSASEIASLRGTQELAMPDTCTISRPTKTNDGYGTSSVSYSLIATTSVRVVSEPARDDEVLGAAVKQPQSWKLTLPHDTDIHIGDIVDIANGPQVVVAMIITHVAWETAKVVKAVQNDV